MKTAVQTLEEQYAERAAQAMAREIDREMLWGMLKGIGWTRVMISRSQDNDYAIDISYWLDENCQGAYERNGRDFIFELEKDASMFILRWV
jgi:hypothetical protein